MTMTMTTIDGAKSVLGRDPPMEPSGTELSEKKRMIRRLACGMGGAKNRSPIWGRTNKRVDRQCQWMSTNGQTPSTNSSDNDNNNNGMSRVLLLLLNRLMQLSPLFVYVFVFRPSVLPPFLFSLSRSFRSLVCASSRGDPGWHRLVSLQGTTIGPEIICLALSTDTHLRIPK